MVAPEDFQVWKRVVDNNLRATLICEDGNDHVVTAENIPYADFPAPGLGCGSGAMSSICQTRTEFPWGLISDGIWPHDIPDR